MKECFAQDGKQGTLDHEAFAAMLAKQFAAWPDEVETLGITGDCQLKSKQLGRIVD